MEYKLLSHISVTFTTACTGYVCTNPMSASIYLGLPFSKGRRRDRCPMGPRRRSPCVLLCLGLLPGCSGVFLGQRSCLGPQPLLRSPHKSEDHGHSPECESYERLRRSRLLAGHQQSRRPTTHSSCAPVFLNLIRQVGHARCKITITETPYSSQANKGCLVCKTRKWHGDMFRFVAW